MPTPEHRTDNPSYDPQLTVSEVQPPGRSQAVQGTFSFKDPEGSLYVFSYEASPDDYLIRNITKQEFYPQGKYQTDNSVTIKYYSSLDNLLNDSPYAIQDRNSAVTSVEDNAKQKSLVNASYKFGYSADGQTRHEEADGDGNVHGSYSYTDVNGQKTRVNYEASARSGFLIKKVEHLAPEPVQSVVHLKENAGEIKTLNVQSNSQEKIVIDTAIYKLGDDKNTNGKMGTPNVVDSIRYGRDRRDYRMVTDSHSAAVQSTPQVTLGTRRAVAVPERRYNRIRQIMKRRKVVKKQPVNYTKLLPDGSYAFSYTVDDHTRQQAVDAKGNVFSSYQYKNKDNGQSVYVFQTNSAVIPKIFFGLPQ